MKQPVAWKIQSLFWIISDPITCWETYQGRRQELYTTFEELKHKAFVRFLNKRTFFLRSRDEQKKAAVAASAARARPKICSEDK